MLDRSKPPVITFKKQLRLPAFDLVPIRPELQLLSIKDETKKEVQIHFVVERSIATDIENFSISELLMPCLVGSTKNRTKEELHTLLDNYATRITGCATSDVLMLSMTCADAKHVVEVLPLFIDILTQPLFCKKEVEEIKRKQQQMLQIMGKVPDVLGIKKIEDLLYGKHPYGYSLEEEHIGLVTAQNLNSLFDSIAWSFGLVLLSGAIDENIIKMVKSQFKRIPEKKHVIMPSPVFDTIKNWKGVITTEHNQQSTIKLAKRTISSSHPDGPALRIVCELLGGGYIGSLLMQNVREKKGLTYGIYCRLMRALHDDVILISASIKKGAIEETKKDIFEQINSLREELVTDRQLDQLKRHYQGTLNALMDDKMMLGMGLMRMYMQKQSFSDFEKIYAKVDSITPEELQQVARRHLEPNQFVQVIVNP